MYTNQAVAAGIEQELSPSDLDLLLTRSDEVGVTPAIEVTPSTFPSSVDLVRAQGFSSDANSDITLLTRSLTTGTIIDAPDNVDIRPVVSEADLRLWQETSAAGWGHSAIESRRASDAFAAAAHTLENEFMTVAYDSVEGRPVGCASMTVRDGVAMIGGMSTLSAERRRGVQAALVQYRLNEARALGCDLAAATAAKGGASQRNLERHGFTSMLTIERFTLG